MVSLLNMVLLGVFGALAAVALLASIRHVRRATLWVSKFALVLITMLVLAALLPDVAGVAGAALWLTLVWIPLSAYSRSVKAVLLEDYAAARRWAGRAALLHPADGFRQQTELIDLVERLDNGDIESGLAGLRALDRRLPDHEFYSPVDDLRFAGDWEGVRAWMERELTPEQRQSPRHALPYLMSLAETGDLEALLRFHAHVAPGLQRLRSWGFAGMAQFIVAVACGRRAEVETLLTGPLKGLAQDAAGVARAATRIAAGEVEAGRATLRDMRERVNHSNRVFIDRRLRLDPPDTAVVDDPEFVATLEASRPTRRLGLIRRTVRVAAVLMLLVLASTYWAPWREQGPPSAFGDPLEYLERVHGTDDADANLPMIVDLHGWGWVPEFHGRTLGQLGTPVRVIVPAGPIAEFYGRSWYAEVGEDWEATLDDSADRLAELIRHLTTLRPTQGKPIITGFSQGGTMAFALATRHPDLIAASFPVAGALPRPPPPWGGSGVSIPVIAFHGEDDESMHPDAARETVSALRAGGWDAELRTYAEVKHELNDTMLDQLHDEIREVIRLDRGRSGER